MIGVRSERRCDGLLTGSWTGHMQEKFLAFCEGVSLGDFRVIEDPCVPEAIKRKGKRKKKEKNPN